MHPAYASAHWTTPRLVPWGYLFVLWPCDLWSWNLIKYPLIHARDNVETSQMHASMDVHKSLYTQRQTTKTKVSPVQDWRATSPVNQTDLTKNFFEGHTSIFSKSHHTKTRTDIKNLAQTNLDIFLYFKNQQSLWQLPLKMAEKSETDFENGRISKFKCHVTLTLTLDLAIWHTAMHHSSTST